MGFTEVWGVSRINNLTIQARRHTKHVFHATIPTDPPKALYSLIFLLEMASSGALTKRSLATRLARLEEKLGVDIYDEEELEK